MKIRPAEKTDLAAIVEIYNQAVTAQATADLEPVTIDDRRDWLERHPADRRPVLVAVRGEDVVGWSSLSDYRPGRGAVRHTAEISYYVHASNRRQGVAAALVRRSIELCPSAGIKTLFAILLEDNLASVRLLEGLGFERWGRMPRVAEFAGKEVGHLYYGRRVV
jgi:phosphinothricin acetyltransferase